MVRLSFTSIVFHSESIQIEKCLVGNYFCFSSWNNFQVPKTTLDKIDLKLVEQREKNHSNCVTFHATLGNNSIELLIFHSFVETREMFVHFFSLGPDKFAEIFLGEFDTPEAIWNSEMR